MMHCPCDRPVWDCLTTHFRNAVIIGPADTPFEDGTFRLVMHFEEQYPNKPPGVKFISQMFHPNVYGTGELCLDILQNRWSPTYDVAAILTSIQRYGAFTWMKLAPESMGSPIYIAYSTIQIHRLQQTSKPRTSTKTTDESTPSGCEKPWRRVGMIRKLFGGMFTKTILSQTPLISMSG